MSDELRKALEPFAAIAERNIPDSWSDKRLYQPMLTVGDYRRAARALAASSPPSRSAPDHVGDEELYRWLVDTIRPILFRRHLEEADTEAAAGECAATIVRLSRGSRSTFSTPDDKAIFDDVREQVRECALEGIGFWRSCSGCYETNEGYPTALAHPAFGCALGGGCSECGGIGAIWDTTDYGAMADAMLTAAPPAPSEEPRRLVFISGYNAGFNADDDYAPEGAWAAHENCGAHVAVVYAPSPAGDEGVADRLRQALKWALPLAESALETHRIERVRSGHNDIRGIDAKGNVVIGLWQVEIDQRDAARAALSASSSTLIPVEGKDK